MLLADFIKDGVASLEALYPRGEAEASVLRLCEDRLGVKSYTHIIEPSTEVPPTALEGLRNDMHRLADGEPLQYVLGWTEFCGMRFSVGPGVLIPRPETEEMTRRICTWLHTLPYSARVLDLCTGSGCIAWSIFRQVPGTEVVGVDISDEALVIARGQGEGDGPVFLKEDILSDQTQLDGEFDLVVSNPPYVMEKEKASMRRNVLDYEPALALFVPDSDPLLFYRAVAGRAWHLLRDGGTGMVEINEALGDETAAVFRDSGFREVRLVRDFLGKNRFVVFTKQGS